jgi:hypothetical protein
MSGRPTPRRKESGSGPERCRVRKSTVLGPWWTQLSRFLQPLRSTFGKNVSNRRVDRRSAPLRSAPRRLAPTLPSSGEQTPGGWQPRVPGGVTPATAKMPMSCNELCAPKSGVALSATGCLGSPSRLRNRAGLATAHVQADVLGEGRMADWLWMEPNGEFTSWNLARRSARL